MRPLRVNALLRRQFRYVGKVGKPGIVPSNKNYCTLPSAIRQDLIFSIPAIIGITAFDQRQSQLLCLVAGVELTMSRPSFQDVTLVSHLSLAEIPYLASVVTIYSKD